MRTTSEAKEIINIYLGDENSKGSRPIAVLLAATYLERRTRTLLINYLLEHEEELKKLLDRYLTLGPLFGLAREKGLIDKNYVEDLGRLVDARNKMAHKVLPFRKLSSKKKAEYEKLARNLLRFLEATD